MSHDACIKLCRAYDTDALLGPVRGTGDMFDVVLGMTFLQRDIGSGRHRPRFRSGRRRRSLRVRLVWPFTDGRWGGSWPESAPRRSTPVAPSRNAGLLQLAAASDLRAQQLDDRQPPRSWTRSRSSRQHTGPGGKRRLGCVAATGHRAPGAAYRRPGRCPPSLAGTASSSDDPSARSSGCADLSDEQSERDADCDREHHGHDDENHESQSIIVGSLSRLPVSFLRTMTAAPEDSPGRNVPLPPSHARRADPQEREPNYSGVQSGSQSRFRAAPL